VGSHGTRTAFLRKKNNLPRENRQRSHGFTTQETLKSDFAQQAVRCQPVSIARPQPDKKRSAAATLKLAVAS
jgi:hypothetical protein